MIPVRNIWLTDKESRLELSLYLKLLWPFCTSSIITVKSLSFIVYPVKLI
jgi:hypothetical protein